MHMTVRQYSFNTLLLIACCFPLHVAVRQHSFNTLLLTLHHIYMDVQHHPVNALFYVIHDVNKVWTSSTYDTLVQTIEPAWFRVTTKCDLLKPR